MFNEVKLSLSDILGEEYIEKVASVNAFFGCTEKEEIIRLANEKVDFYSQKIQEKNDELLKSVGKQVTDKYENNNDGAPTDSFKKAMSKQTAPISGYLNYRVGEDGKLYLIGKSEHYHASLGHRFNGYKLIDNARKIGILNATHNNTRGYVTRLHEIRLVQSANGVEWEDDKATAELLDTKDEKVLNRVINLETGSLAVEAGIKMMLARFYKLDNSRPEPVYSGKIPVFFVMGDLNGGLEANYHGTTVLAQTLRGMWPDFYDKETDSEIYKVVPVKINDIVDFRAKLEEYNEGKYKTAGFLHEIVLMNYGGIKLDEAYLKEAYKLCDEYDTPKLCDEIQSCMWYKGMFLYRLYGLKPDFVIIGKGFPGGEYPASRIITNARMDSLNQFGALVTNGQEELASLAYLITMSFSRANGDEIERIGQLWNNEMKKLHADFPDKILAAQGLGHLASLHFVSADKAAEFASRMKEKCIDTSAQLYKKNCFPAVLLKPSLITTEKTVMYIVGTIRDILNEK